MRTQDPLRAIALRLQAICPAQPADRWLPSNAVSYGPLLRCGVQYRPSLHANSLGHATRLLAHSAAAAAAVAMLVESSPAAATMQVRTAVGTWRVAHRKLAAMAASPSMVLVDTSSAEGSSPGL